VTIDPATGSFDGYAWGENVGWIHFKGTDPAYNVVTTFTAADAQPVGGATEPVGLLALLWPWVALAALVGTGAIATVAFKRRAA
jgi:hypothetical protein